MISSVAVVYWGGTCGTFVRQLLIQLMRDKYEDIVFSKNGSAHHFKSTHGFSSKKLVSHQTHDFSKIPELRSNYETVVAITVNHESKKQFIIRSINVILKYCLEKHENNINENTMQHIPNIINYYLGHGYEKLVDEIYDCRFDHEYHDIFVYFASKNLFVDDRCFFDEEKAMYGPTDGCVLLPFTCILECDVKTFATIIEQVVKQKLTDEQQSFVENTLIRYHSSQNMLLFSDPYKYHAEVRERALTKLEILQREFIHSSYNGR